MVTHPAKSGGNVSCIGGQLNAVRMIESRNVEDLKRWQEVFKMILKVVEERGLRVSDSVSKTIWMSRELETSWEVRRLLVSI
jgi:enamine deaminase RidA (YjgF/YER057c/UK114 family)